MVTVGISTRVRSMLYCVNHTVKWHVDFQTCVCRLLKIKEWVDKHDPGSAIIPFSGAFELDMMHMEEEEKAAYCKEHGVQRWVRQQVHPEMGGATGSP